MIEIGLCNVVTFKVWMKTERIGLYYRFESWRPGGANSINLAGPPLKSAQVGGKSPLQAHAKHVNVHC